MREPVFTETLQVAIVVRDLEAGLRRDRLVESEQRRRSTRASSPEKGEGVHHLASRSSAPGASRSPWSGQVQWELIEPLDDESMMPLNSPLRTTPFPLSEIFSGTPGADLKPDATLMA
jgi:hypothetical protein